MRIVISAIGVLIWALILMWHLTPERLLENVPFGSVVLDSREQILHIGLAEDDKYRLYAPLEHIAPEVITATLDYEDKYFYSHPGVNAVSLIRGALSLLGRQRRQGGSTITMQVARLKWHLRTSHIWGKLQQIVLALSLELRHSKQDILEAYFNLAPYGGNVEGIEAAARIYFHKSALRLTTSESTALAVVPQNPNARHPLRGSKFQAARGRIATASTPLKIFGTAELPFEAPHLALEFKKPQHIVKLTIESDLQRMLARNLERYIRRQRSVGIANGAAMLVRCSDMAVVASVGSASFYRSDISGQIDGTKVRRSPGSTLKPFIYALALDQGLIHPNTVLSDSPRSFGGYDPENFDRTFQGPVAAAAALQASRNLPAITLAEQLSDPGLYGFLRQAQVQFPCEADHYGLALVLGGAEVTMRELAALYGMLANQGLWQPLRFGKDGESEAPMRLLSPEAAWLTLEMLRRPEAKVNSRGVKVSYFYKTGTSNGFRDAWTVGIIGDYVLLVWLGNFDNRANPRLVGAVSALPLFEEMAQALAASRPLGERSSQPPQELNLIAERICPSTGDIYKNQCANPIPGWLILGVSPLRDTGIYRQIYVNGQGERACTPNEGEPIWYEAWPADLRQIFAEAGIYKPDLPPLAPECTTDFAPTAGPRILLPKRNVTYYRQLQNSDFAIPLRASADANVSALHWYAGRKYIGSTRPGETTLWCPDAGQYDLTVVDNTGRSASQRCQIVNLAQ